MASQHVLVEIVDGERTIDKSVRRPVRLTPDGYAGIVYGGAVYPVFPNSVVDIAGPSWETEDCNRFLMAGTDVPYALTAQGAVVQGSFAGFLGEWNVETSRFGHNVVFNASERIASDVVAALDAGGLAVQRWDVSHRPANDGKFYDWFARLRLRGTHDEVMSRVAALLSPTAANVAIESPREPEVARVEDLASQVEKLLDQTVALRLRLDTSEAEAVLLRQQLIAVTNRELQLSGELDRVLNYQKSLHDQIAELGRAPELANATQVLLAQQLETEEFLEFVLAENGELRNSLANFRNHAEQGDSRISSLEATVSGLKETLEELGQQERERRRAAVTPVTPRRGVLGFLDTAFARLTFVLDSAEVLANLDAPAALMRVLVQIDMGSSVGKDLEGLRGWREVSKVATGIAGSEAMGRVYYKPDGGQVLVSVHIKQDDKEQRRHIDRLRSV